MFIKFEGYKINVQKSVLFLPFRNQKLKILKTIIYISINKYEILKEQSQIRAIPVH